MRYNEIAKHVDLDRISIDQLSDVLKIDSAPTAKSVIDLPPERIDFLVAMYGQHDDPDDALTLAKAEAERARARASRAAADADRARAARDRAEAEATRAETRVLRRQSRSNISKRSPRPTSRPR